MNCRYCGGMYSTTERTCAGCGSPKTFVETLLDVPAAPGHWSHSMLDTVQRVAVVTAGVVAGAWLLSLVGMGTLGAVVAVLWVIPVSPAMLWMGVWQSSIGNLQARLRNFFLGGFLWIGVVIAMLLWLALVVAG